jgi:membrane-associated phospholipid phosphatase
MLKTKNFSVLLVAIILLGLTICGSFFDYQLANDLYIGQRFSDNVFGVIFAFIGIIPVFVGWSFLGASILYLSRKNVENVARRRLLIALSILLFVLSFFYFCNTLMMVNSNAFAVHWAIAYPIGILVILGASYLGYKLSKKSDNPELLKTLIFLAFVSLLTMVIIMSTKGIMDRPRFRFVLDSLNGDYFRNFWQSGSDIKANMQTKVVSDEFSSFPSGHSAYSMFAIFLFPAFGEYIPKMRKYKPLLFVIGFIWWVLTALSRLTVGAHYLTDVTIAGLVTLLCYVVVKYIWLHVEKRII